MYSGLLNHCLREATSALRQNKLACRTPLYCNRAVCHYASVGGATRHTVIALPVVQSVIVSVCYTIFAAYAER